MNIKPPRGALLYGAPGCGKTLAIRALVAESKRRNLEVYYYGFYTRCECMTKGYYHIKCVHYLDSDSRKIRKICILDHICAWEYVVSIDVT